MTATTKGIGTLIISIDLELAWGNRGKTHFTPLHMLEREAITQFLLLCEKYVIPCTWATVGNLFLSGVGEAKQRDIELFGQAAILYDLIAEKKTDESLWFGADIVECILSCRTEQEIGCHTFFHTLTQQTTPSEFERELKQAMQIGKEKYGLLMKSFVYPRNYVGMCEVLRRVGLTNYRGNEQVQFFGGRFGQTRVADYIESLCALPIPAVQHRTTDDGLVVLPASYFFGKVLARGILVPMSLRLLRSMHGIDRSIHDGGIFHLWFHPHNMAQDISLWMRSMEVLFQYVAHARERGELHVTTMGGFTDTIQTAI